MFDMSDWYKEFRKIPKVKQVITVIIGAGIVAFSIMGIIGVFGDFKSTVAGWFSADSVSVPEASLSILSPEKLSIIQEETFSVSGQSENLPEGSVIYVFVEQPIEGKLNRYWIQSNGRSVPSIDGKWESEAFISLELDAGKRMEIIAIAVNGEKTIGYLDEIIADMSRGVIDPFLGPPGTLPPLEGIVALARIPVTATDEPKQLQIESPALSVQQEDVIITPESDLEISTPHPTSIPPEPIPSVVFPIESRAAP